MSVQNGLMTTKVCKFVVVKLLFMYFIQLCKLFFSVRLLFNIFIQMNLNYLLKKTETMHIFYF